MKKSNWIGVMAMMPSLAMAWPWSMDMANQPSIKPQEGPKSVRSYPEHSIPMGGTRTTIRVADRDAAEKLDNPQAASEESIHYGRKMFHIYCRPCHGVTGKGDGPVGEKLNFKPFDLTTDRVQKEVKDGYIFGIMTFGGAVMPSYANDMYPKERWDLVNYVKHGLVKDDEAMAKNPALLDAANKE